MILCRVRCGPDEECILDVVPREDGARNWLRRGVGQAAHTLNNPQAEYIGSFIVQEYRVIAFTTKMYE